MSQLITKTCPICEASFESEVDHHKVYDKPACKRKAKRMRVGAAAPNEASVAWTPTVYENTYPSDIVLTFCAQGLLASNDPRLDFGVQFSAVTTTWQPPEGIAWLIRPDGNAVMMRA